MSQHKQCEIMCALAAVGQLSAPDLARLSQHVEACADCQRRLSEFAQVSAQALMLFGEKYGNNHKPPAGMTARFIARARAEGIPLRKSAISQPREFLCPPGWKGNVAAALLMLAVIAGISNRPHSLPFSTSTIGAGANPTGEITVEPKSAQVCSPPLLKPRHVARRAKRHRLFETTGGTVKGVQPSEPTFNAALGLTPSTARYCSNCDQREGKLDPFVFAKAAEAKQPGLFKAFATSQQRRPVAPWLISLNSLPPLFPYATNGATFLRTPQMGMSQPSVDLSKIRLGAFPEFSGARGWAQYRQMPEQRWPFSTEFKVDAR